jgi:hypothetical protein
MTRAEDPVGFLGRLLLALLVFHVSRKWFGWIVGIIAGFFAFTRGGEVVDYIKERLTERS